MSAPVTASAPYALSPRAALAALRASRESLGRSDVKLLEIAPRAAALAGAGRYCIIGGVAQILWARKTHTDDLDVAVLTADARRAYETIEAGVAPEPWRLPTPEELQKGSVHESGQHIQVYHLMHGDSVVAFVAFHDGGFESAVLDTVTTVPELGGLPFIRPELLLVTQLLRPGSRAALAAVELILAREELGGLDLEEARRWSRLLGVEAQLDRTLERVQAFRP